MLNKLLFLLLLLAIDPLAIEFLLFLCLKVNGTSVEDATHDQAVALLKSAGEVVTLLVKYFRPASLFLNKSKLLSQYSYKHVLM